MNDVLTSLHSLLSGYFKNNDNKLEEPSEGMSIPIEKGNLRYLSYTFDKNLRPKDFPKGLFPFLNKNEGVHSMCDYMLFCIHDHKLFILLAELKHGKNGVMTQLNAGKCLAEFIVQTLNRLEDLSLRPEIRLIAVRNSHIINKRGTKMRDVEYDDHNFCTFEGNRFYLKEYLK